MTDYAVIDPHTGQTIASYPSITDDELAAAIAATDAAHTGWSRSSTVAERAALLHEVAELHRARAQELGAIIVREMGKPIDQAVAEVEFSADIYDFYAQNGEELLRDEPITLAAGSAGTAVIRKASLGVLLGIMPWNFPYYQVARFAGPNLLIGNTIVLKHAPQCPESAAAIEQIFHDAGFPAGAYVNVYASNEQIETVIADPRVRGVSLTGSERAGTAVARLAGQHLKKVVLELGGSDPFILLSTDDLDQAVEAAVAARLETRASPATRRSASSSTRPCTSRSSRSSPPRSPRWRPVTRRWPALSSARCRRPRPPTASKTRSPGPSPRARRWRSKAAAAATPSPPRCSPT